MIIDRYLYREILRPFALGLGLLIVVFVGFSLARQLAFAAAGQIDLVTALRLVALNTLVTLEILLPSALFFSVLAALGKLYHDAEMTSLFASGVSPLRVLGAVFKLAAVFAVITAILSIEGRPWAYRESYRLEAQAAAEFDLRKMATGEFVTMGNSDYVFIADGLDLERGRHESVFLQKIHSDGERSELIFAEAAALPTLNPEEPFTAQFFHGFHYLLDNRATLDVTTEFETLTIRLPATEAQERYRRKAESTSALAASQAPKDIAEYQWRLTTPLATLLLALIATPLARSHPRESRSRGFFIAIGAYIGVFSLTSMVKTWIEQERIGALPGLWGSYAVLAVVLVLLMYPPRLRRRARSTAGAIGPRA
jgi:lipopolysaccharide export system permease protein